MNNIFKDHNQHDFVIVNIDDYIDFNLDYKIIYIRENKQEYNKLISKFNVKKISDTVYKQDNKITILNYEFDKVIDKIIKNNSHVVILLCYDNINKKLINKLIFNKNVDILLKVSKDVDLDNNYRKYYFDNFNLLYISNKDKISYINELNNSKFKSELIQMFESMLGKSHINILDEKLTDYEYYMKLKNGFNKTFNFYSSEINYKRAYSRWNVFNKYIKNKINSYIDFGGGNGDMAYIIGKQILKLNKNDVFVIDKESFVSTKWKPRDDITFYENIDNVNKTVDLITSFHVLHHIENVETYVEKIINKLNKNGYLILYEHNVTDRLLFNLVDIQHQIYSIVFGNISYENYFKESYSNYRSTQQWINLFRKLKLIKIINFHKYDQTNCLIFIKK
jgi:2-polyprenyl-3-methyl-5-hydroxy-6-metoxy-1,4-benzoquinol methylase